ncbi:MAG: GNAT family acetyltransferase [Cyanobacteria bacterium J06607_6]
MEIRKFREKDRQSLIDLWQACELTRPWNDPDQDITRKISIQPDLLLVGELNGQIIASAMAGYDGHRGSVFYLAVAPAFQQRGYGQALMTEVERLLTAMGCPKLNIVIRSSNQQVLDFYRGLGYATDDVVSIGKRLIADT